MSNPPAIVPRAERLKRGLRPLMLEILSENPELSDKQLALQCGCAPASISAMRKSDTFRHDLAQKIRHRYGDLLNGSYRNQLVTEQAALQRLRRDLNDDAKSTQEHHSAAKLALEHAQKTAFAASQPQSPTKGDTHNTQVNLTITSDALDRAKTMQLEHAKNFALEDQHADTTQMANEEHSYLSARREEGDEI